MDDSDSIELTLTEVNTGSISNLISLWQNMVIIPPVDDGWRPLKVMQQKARYINQSSPFNLFFKFDFQDWREERAKQEREHLYKVIHLGVCISIFLILMVMMIL